MLIHAIDFLRLSIISFFSFNIFIISRLSSSEFFSLKNVPTIKDTLEFF